MKKMSMVMMVATLIGMLAACSELETDTSSEPKAKTEEKAETKKEYTIGQDVKVGKMVFKANDKTVTDQVGPSVLPTNAKGQFLVLDVTVKNNGDDAVMIDSSFFKIKKDGKTYESDSAASISANQKEDGSINVGFFGEELNPGSEMTGKVVFDVAQEIAGAQYLELQVQTGIFGTETQIITLK